MRRAVVKTIRGPRLREILRARARRPPDTKIEIVTRVHDATDHCSCKRSRRTAASCFWARALPHPPISFVLASRSLAFCGRRLTPLVALVCVYVSRAVTRSAGDELTAFRPPRANGSATVAPRPIRGRALYQPACSPVAEEVITAAWLGCDAVHSLECAR